MTLKEAFVALLKGAAIDPDCAAVAKTSIDAYGHMPLEGPAPGVLITFLQWRAPVLEALETERLIKLEALER